MKLVIGNKNYSSWSLRAWLMLKQAGIDFEEIPVPLYAEGYKERILAYSPSGKVPCLIDGDAVVWDSLAIGEYLAEKHPSLWPADIRERSLARCISAEMHAGFTALRTHMGMNIRKDYSGKGRTAEVEADISRIVSIWDECRNRHAPSGPFLFGAFSIADAMYAPVCFRFKTYAVEPGGVAGVYMRHVLALPAMREWQAAAETEAQSIPGEDLYG